MRAALLATCLAAISLSAFAQEIEIVALDEALVGATALTAIDGHMLIVANDNGSFICDISIDPNFFPSIGEGMAKAAAYYAPNATCVASSVFKSVGKN